MLWVKWKPFSPRTMGNDPFQNQPKLKSEVKLCCNCNAVVECCRLYLRLILGNVNVTLLSKQSK